MTSSDRFPVPVRSAVKSNLTDWCFQNISKHALNALTVQASTTELGKLFQIFTMHAEKKCNMYVTVENKHFKIILVAFIWPRIYNIKKENREVKMATYVRSVARLPIFFLGSFQPLSGYFTVHRICDGWPVCCGYLSRCSTALWPVFMSYSAEGRRWSWPL